jgi:hypothetical protein
MATGITLQQLTQRPRVIDLFSRVKTPPSLLSQFLGFTDAKGNRGSNVMPVGGRNFQYDIMDRERGLAQMRAPGTPAATGDLTPVGEMHGTFPRVHEKLPIGYERIFRGRPLGMDWSAPLDVMGMRYIDQQVTNFKQKFVNTREFMASRMLRGSFQIKKAGDDQYPVDTGGSITVNYQVPAGNKSQLNMLGAGNCISATWATVGTDIIGDVNKINAAFEVLHGFPLRHMWMTSVMWANLTNNTGIKAAAGTANVAWTEYNIIEGETTVDGRPVNAFTARLKAFPWIEIHIYDGGMMVDGTFTKTIPDTVVIFTPDPDPQWVELLEGSEPASQQDGAPIFEAMGMEFWSANFANPPRIEYYGIDNSIPALRIPTCVAYGTCVFG